eukprot:COSAG01_NODE_3119_length_6560_cov_719.065315_3_plen_255_part_00
MPPRKRSLKVNQRTLAKTGGLSRKFQPTLKGFVRRHAPAQGPGAAAGPALAPGPGGSGATVASVAAAGAAKLLHRGGDDQSPGGAHGYGVAAQSPLRRRLGQQSEEKSTSGGEPPGDRPAPAPPAAACAIDKKERVAETLASGHGRQSSAVAAAPGQARADRTSIRRMDPFAAAAAGTMAATHQQPRDPQQPPPKRRRRTARDGGHGTTTTTTTTTTQTTLATMLPDHVKRAVELQDAHETERRIKVEQLRNIA